MLLRTESHMPNRIYIFDTTLRDGEQSPGASLNVEEKLEIARQLERLGVDVIEAGFPVSSPGDFQAVQAISRLIKNCTVCGLTRVVQKDIEDVEYFLEDSGRADRDYLCRVMEAVIKAGATVINIPDTTGYTTPEEYGALFRGIREHVPNSDRAILSAHCPNDLGMATA